MLAQFVDISSWNVSKNAAVSLGASLSWMSLMVWVWVTKFSEQSVAVHCRVIICVQSSVVIDFVNSTFTSWSQASIAVSASACGSVVQFNVRSSGSVSTNVGAWVSLTMMV